MIKYPVTSENGNVYIVEFFEGESIAYFGLNAFIYKPYVKRFLGFKFKRKKYLTTIRCRCNELNYIKYKFNHVGFIKYAVKKYEDSIILENEKLTREKQAHLDLLNWDGQC